MRITRGEEGKEREKKGKGEERKGRRKEREKKGKGDTASSVDDAVLPACVSR